MDKSLYWANWLSKQEFLDAIDDQVQRLHEQDFHATVLASWQEIHIQLPTYGHARILLTRDAGCLDHETGLEMAIILGIASRSDGKIVITNADGIPLVGIDQMASYVKRALNLMDRDETYKMLAALGLIIPGEALSH